MAQSGATTGQTCGSGERVLPFIEKLRWPSTGPESIFAIFEESIGTQSRLST